MCTAQPDPWTAFAAKMRAAGLPAELIGQFQRLYRRYHGGATGWVDWHEIGPPDAADIVDLDRCSEPTDACAGEAALDSLVCIKVNGGLGTTMNLQRAKSLIAVRDGRSFLDIIAAQVQALRDRHGARIPLLLMNSFRTRDDSLAALASLSQPGELPRDFLQHRVPRIDARSQLPATLSRADDEWAPPGHGDIYLAIWLSGLLQRLLTEGYRWALVSNADNLAATVDLRLLGYLQRMGLDFAMEVTPKTAADIKGGTLVRHRGRLTLLERGQVAPADQARFDDLSTFGVFNTNTLWWRIEAVAQRMRSGSLDLPLIVNPKRVDGLDLVQLETAMGAAVGCFERAVGICVPRQRFAPVKAISDLLAVRSDAYQLDALGGLRINPARDPALGPPLVQLDAQVYESLPDLEQRFAGPPSLIGCRSLEIRGDVQLEAGVVIEGDVVLDNRSGRPQRVQRGARLANQTRRW